MPIELMMTAYAVALLFVLIAISGVVGTTNYSLPELTGNRDDLGAPSAFFGRAKRTVDNHREGLILWAPLAIMVVMTDNTTANTALAAQIFIASRVAHAICYLVGIPWLRTLVWIPGIVATVMMFLALL